MKTKDKKKTSSKRKLAPAIAMLTTSAVMLTTATYAWFTIGKEAQVTGLQMSATASGGLEISLGHIGTNGALTRDRDSFTPSMDNSSWKSNINVGEYYETVAKLSPASSINGTSLFEVDKGISAGGTKVESTQAVTAVDNVNYDALTLRSTYEANGTIKEGTSTDPKYYADVPLWIRSSTATNIKCKVDITDAQGSSETTKELQKAVRVALIPINSAEDIATSSDHGTNLKIEKTATPSSSGTVNFFATDYTGYNDNKALSDASTFSASLAAVTATEQKANEEVSNVISIDAPESGKYSVKGFIVRVWLEGESTSCKDVNAGQDWNISLKFTADDAQS